MIIKKLLKLNLQFFAEDNADNSPDGALKAGEQAIESSTGGETGQPTDKMIPKNSFDEVNQKYKDVQTKLDELQAEKHLADRRAQEESGEFKTLYETTSKEYSEFKEQFITIEDRNKQLEGVINSLLETKLHSIPGDFHDLIPDNLTPEAKLEWINKAETKGLFGKVPQQPVGEQTNGSEQTGITKENFQKMGYTERTKLYGSNPDLYKRLSR